MKHSNTLNLDGAERERIRAVIMGRWLAGESIIKPPE